MLHYSNFGHKTFTKTYPIPFSTSYDYKFYSGDIVDDWMTLFNNRLMFKILIFPGSSLMILHNDYQHEITLPPGQLTINYI